MNLQSQIRNDDQKHSIKAATVAHLVASLRQTERALRASIEVEEEKTCFNNRNDPCYSMLARSMRERADNIRVTIGMLEAAREAA